MKTVILAGGKGTRIASITSEIPKALIPVNGIPVLEHQVIWLVTKAWRVHIYNRSSGKQDKGIFRHRREMGREHRIFRRESPLGTAGALALS